MQRDVQVDSMLEAIVRMESLLVKFIPAFFEQVHPCAMFAVFRLDCRATWMPLVLRRLPGKTSILGQAK
jgi:hypothetical protein